VENIQTEEVRQENTFQASGNSQGNIYAETSSEEPVMETQVSKDIFPTEAYELMTENRDDNDFIILDVCTPGEFEKLHLENALNINFFSSDFKDQLKALDKNKIYLVYCKIGGRSKMAQKMMKKLGFREVYNIVGGTILWEEEGLPFAPGLGRRSRFTLCPISNLIILVFKAKKFFQRGYESFLGMLTTAGLLRKDLSS
jgi:rhodanese-related sulfurtransferase